jgi:hypothetical protein
VQSGVGISTSWHRRKAGIGAPPATAQCWHRCKAGISTELENGNGKWQLATGKHRCKAGIGALPASAQGW